MKIGECMLGNGLTVGWLKPFQYISRLRQPVVLNHSVEELKAAVASTISEFMKLENSFTNFQLSCATFFILI
jgi:hypothetical protein